MSKELRWEQRFENLESAFGLLEEALTDGTQDLSDLEKEGVIQRFEYTFELAWKTLKDYLEFSGIVMEQVTPRAVIKQAFAAKIISDGEMWITMLEQRNLMSHTYNQEIFEKVIEQIEDGYFFALQQLMQFFRKQAS
jgi:nucleotidyltransferase substrate binding protein (TIGR01987 family)